MKSMVTNLKLIPAITNWNQAGLVLHLLNPPPIHHDIHKQHSQEGEEEEEEETEHAEEKLHSASEFPSLTDFEEICPAPEAAAGMGGSSHSSIILYTTSMRGIRKTFQDCNTIRFLLRSFKVKYHERDVSLHLEYREELWKILGGKVIPPKLFVKGRYIGGADEVVGLHEMGWLGKLLEGTPTEVTLSPCAGCASLTFAICSNCSGSRKVFAGSSDKNNDDDFFIRCPDCNENGLVKCHICC